MSQALHVSRRTAIGTLAGLAAMPGVKALATMPSGRPNILWLVSEDNNPFIGAYGDPLAHTPAIDTLARKGLLYRNAFSNAPVCAPSRFGILTGMYPESCSPANHMRAVAHWPEGFRTYPELMRQAGYFCTNNVKTDYNCDVDPAAIWDRQGPEASWRDRSQGQPFLCVHNFMITHESNLFKPTAGRITPDMVQIPAHLPDTPEIRQDFASYYNLMEKMDAQLGGKLAELEADGLADDTIIFYYSDNGGSLPRSKRYCYDEGLRCALVIHVPPKWRHWMPAPPGSEITSPVSFIDLAPTLLSIAQVPQPGHMPGKPFLGPANAGPQTYAFGMRNRMDERIDFVRTVTDGRWRYIRNYMPHRPWGQHGAFEWLAKGYQSWEREHLAGRLNAVQDRFFRTKPYEELFDLAADPDQVHNLANDPAQSERLAALSQALDRHMLAIHDNGFLPEAMPGEGYAASRDPGLYPLAQVMRLGERAARGNPDAYEEFVMQLQSKVDVLRYWAATGLLILGPKARHAKAALRQVVQADGSPQVRIVAAEALVGLGEARTGVPALAAILNGDQPWQVKLQAINALTFIGDDAKPALGAVQALMDHENIFLRSTSKYLALQLAGQYTPETPIFDIDRLGQS